MHARTRRGALARGAAAALLVLVLGGAATACGKAGTPPPKGPDQGALPAYPVNRAADVPDSPTWKAAKERGKLVVGTKADQPYVAQQDPATGAYSGFDVEIAKMIAADLGFGPDRVEFKTITSANRETALQNGQVDYYAGTYTINDNRKKLVGFAGPYYLAGQSLLVRADEKKIDGPQNLAGKKVCSVAGSTPYQRLQKDYPDVQLVGYDSYSVCVDNLISYQVDAVSTDDTILKGYAAKVPDQLKIAGQPFSQEPYGIGVPRGDRAFRLAIDDALAKYEANGDWKAAYDATLGLSGVPAPAPPPIDRY
ncbi:glutamate ABC transporter substrate-binding protein [Yinghuangia seranimata]|uniref:glutamate ABC transporter substrate-binding protein n=1 Tax=Yinghuangia seranimata TaxID=408067 RepID=UPI00248D2966|nr:glutamate ABC transporter substrate-binding protein [Yinghuangia seranimata]MDI2126612.1 glutamate ABC transporter substrate-binding protein [Yinghuangia seranimata]